MWSSRAFSKPAFHSTSAAGSCGENLSHGPRTGLRNVEPHSGQNLPAPQLSSSLRLCQGRQFPQALLNHTQGSLLPLRVSTLGSSALLTDTWKTLVSVLCPSPHPEKSPAQPPPCHTRRNTGLSGAGSAQGPVSHSHMLAQSDHPCLPFLRTLSLPTQGKQTTLGSPPSPPLLSVYISIYLTSFPEGGKRRPFFLS